MDILLQAWGGGFYLANKILLALAEGRGRTWQRRLRIAGWTAYLAGVPAWVIILVGKHDWIAAAIEAGGVPSMLFGLYTVWTRSPTPHRVFDRLAATATYGFIAMGVGYSLYDNGGLTALSQLFETGVMIGFLLGSYLLAKGDARGWLFFMLMNGSMGSLMFIQQKPLLAAQQLISLCFVVYGFTRSLRRERT